MADQRTMAQFLQAPTEGYKDGIFVSAITADNFELKHGLLTLVQNKQFFGHDKEDPHAHVRYFKKITSALKFPNVLNTSIKLMLFPFSLKGAAQIWLEKEPPQSIFTWDDLVLKFINQFFPLSKTTNLHNEITNFQQRFDESFSEACDRFKDLLRAYKIPCECLDIIENKSKFCYSRNKPVVAKKSQNQSPAPVKAVKESCVTYGGAHSYRNCPATDGNAYHDNIQEFVSQASAFNYNQGNTSYRPLMIFPAPQTQGVSKEDFSAYVKANDAVMRNMQSQGPQIPPSLSFLSKVVEDEPEATKDTVNPTNNRSTKDVQPQEVLGFSDTILSGNPIPYYDLTVSTTSLTLTPFGNSDFLLEEVDAFLAIEDDPTSPKVYQPYLDPAGTYFS
nr:reverse transcriptase domain-containing protein [Tanacetum cinerariifolium]